MPTAVASDTDRFLTFMRSQLDAGALARVGEEFGDLDSLRLGRLLQAFYWSVESGAHVPAPTVIPPFDKGADATRLNASSSKYFIQGGLNHGLALCKVIARLAGSQPLEVLDFGCGSGRLLWVLRQFAPGNRYSACDVNPHAVDMIRRCFPDVNATCMSPSPPTEFPPDGFDLVYGWSIFTHYSEPAHREWLAELMRIVRPGGLVMVTVKSEHRIQRFFEEEKFQMQLKLSKMTQEQAVAHYRSHGYLYLRAYTAAKASAVGIDADSFGNTMISPAYIQQHWGAFGDLVEVVPVAPEFQDLVVLRRRP